jgi:hypothetical protein
MEMPVSGEIVPGLQKHPSCYGKTISSGDVLNYLYDLRPPLLLGDNDESGSVRVQLGSPNFHWSHPNGYIPNRTH